MDTTTTWKFLLSHIAPRDHKSRQRYSKYVDYYAVKHALAKEFNPSRILEIGVRAGYSALAFLSACPDATYTGFDAENGKHGGQGGPWTPWAVKLLQDYHVTIWADIDTQKLANIPTMHGTFDFIHIDGDHTTKGVLHDMTLCWPVLNKGGVMIVDDYSYIDDVHEGVDQFIDENPAIRVEFRESLRGEVLFFKD